MPAMMATVAGNTLVGLHHDNVNTPLFSPFCQASEAPPPTVPDDLPCLSYLLSIFRPQERSLSIRRHVTHIHS